MDRRDQLLLGNIWNEKKQPKCSSEFLISFTSNDFDSDGITLSDCRLLGKHYEIFLNELNRFIYSGTEYDLLTGGFRILLPEFNATMDTYHLYVFLK